MYKVFYNEKYLTLSDKPLPNVKNLAFQNERQFDEALALIKSGESSHVNIYDYNQTMLWESFKNHFVYLEAAGGLVTNQFDEILFIHRFDRWDLPKGKVEDGESVEIAAVREVEEECGITAPEIKNFIDKTYHIYYDNQYILKSTYWFRMNYFGDEKLVPQSEEGIGLAQWKSVDEIELIKPLTYENIRIVLESEGF